MINRYKFWNCLLQVASECFLSRWPPNKILFLSKADISACKLLHFSEVLMQCNEHSSIFTALSGDAIMNVSAILQQANLEEYKKEAIDAFRKQSFNYTIDDSYSNLLDVRPCETLLRQQPLPLPCLRCARVLSLKSLKCPRFESFRLNGAP